MFDELVLLRRQLADWLFIAVTAARVILCSLLHIAHGECEAQAHATGRDLSRHYATPLDKNAHKDLKYWLIQAGIAENWFGLGNTALRRVRSGG